MHGEQRVRLKPERHAQQAIPPAMRVTSTIEFGRGAIISHLLFAPNRLGQEDQLGPVLSHLLRLSDEGVILLTVDVLAGEYLPAVLAETDVAHVEVFEVTLVCEHQVIEASHRDGLLDEVDRAFTRRLRRAGHRQYHLAVHLD